MVGESAPGEIVAAARAIVEAGERIAKSRVELMRGYAETVGCRPEFLLGSFGFFPEQGYRTLELSVVTGRGILTPV